MSSAERATSAVLDGAAFLDRKEGLLVQLHGWRSKIDVEKLDISDGDVCILGQLFDGYSDGVNKLSIDQSGQSEAAYGFAAGHVYGDHIGSQHLTDAWKAYLKPFTATIPPALKMDSVYTHKTYGNQYVKPVVTVKDHYLVYEDGQVVDGLFVAHQYAPEMMSISLFNETYKPFVPAKVWPIDTLLIADKDGATQAFIVKKRSFGNDITIWRLDNSPQWGGEASWEKEGYTNFRKVNVGF